jgi:AcrR family transcriptional regulator
VEATSESSSKLTLSQLVARTGVPASTIHHYRRSGQIPEPQRQSANRFVYDERHVEALLAIRRLPAAEHDDCRMRIVASAIEAFRTRSYAEVSVADIAESAGMAKGNVYRYFPSKESLLAAAIDSLLDDTTERFQTAIEALGGVEAAASEPDRIALTLGYVVADVMPMLLELGARAAKGHEPSADTARRVLRTLAATAGRPYLPDGTDDPEQAIERGLEVIETAFSTVLHWSVGEDWPPDHLQGM